MTCSEPKSVVGALAQRRALHGERRLAVMSSGVDLCSNDYLGISRMLAVEVQPHERGGARLGATGSRLISGTMEAHEALEARLAAFHAAPAALLFGSGYEANIGLLGSLGTRHDTIIYDELVHASMRDGIRLSTARSYSFRHNDLADLRKKMREARGDLFVAVESLYSMDGDTAPLRELCDLCEEVGAFLLVDEAHATGVYGREGAGLVQERGIEGRVYARIHTFGKALGYRGAVVVGSSELRAYLINFARSFIYSTAPDLVMVWYIERAYELMRSADEGRSCLTRLIKEMAALKGEYPGVEFLPSESPIQGIILPSNEMVVQAERALLAHGFLARGIRSPTVPEGSERIRICLHSYNTLEEVRGALRVLFQSRDR